MLFNVLSRLQTLLIKTLWSKMLIRAMQNTKIQSIDRVLVCINTQCKGSTTLSFSINNSVVLPSHADHEALLAVVCLL